MSKIDVVQTLLRAQALTRTTDYLPEADEAHELIIRTVRRMVSFVESTKIYEITFDASKVDDLNTPIEIMMGEVLRIGSVRKRYTLPLKALVLEEKRGRTQEKLKKLNAEAGKLKCAVYTTCTAVQDN